MQVVFVVAGGTLAVLGFVFFGMHLVKSSDLDGPHWSRIPATICLALAFCMFTIASIFPFPNDVMCPSCNKEIYTEHCMDCGSEGILRSDLFQNCPDCGGEIGERERFCGDCGTAVK